MRPAALLAAIVAACAEQKRRDQEADQRQEGK